MKINKALSKTIGMLVEASFKDGKMIEEKVTKSIKVLKSQPRIQAIASLSEYLKQLKRKERQYTMFIETVFPLSDIQLKKMKKIVEKKTMPDGRQAKITKIITSLNPEILGGFKLRVGDEIWDETFFGKVNQVKEAISDGRSN